MPPSMEFLVRKGKFETCRGVDKTPRHFFTQLWFHVVCPAQMFQNYLYYLCVFFSLVTAPLNASEWKYALNEGSPRLLLFTLLKDEPAGSGDLVHQLMRNTGMIHKSHVASLVYSSTYVQPLLSYDQNINGGIPSDIIHLGPFEFIVDEKSRAKSGFLLGGKLGHFRKYSIGFGQTFSFGASGSVEYSYEHNIHRVTGSSFGCYERYVKNWTFLDICLSTNVLKRDGTLERVISPRLSLSKYLGSNFASHEITAALGGVFHQDYSKPYANISTKMIAPEFGAIFLSFYISPEVEGYNTRRWRGEIALGRPILGKYTKVGASYHVENGSSIFGENREDDVFGIRFERDLLETVKVYVTAETRTSTVSAYDGVMYAVNFELRPWLK